MSTVKISQLPFITQLDANTQKTLIAGVDLVSGLTGKISIRTLAERLYSNDVLNVGTNPIILENVVAQFTDSSSEFIQINLQNFDGVGSSDYVASANNSDGSNNYIDLGFNGPGYNDPDYSSMLPYDGYVYSHGPSNTDYRGNLVIGTASSNANVVLIAGGTQSNNIVGRFNARKFALYNPLEVSGSITASGNVSASKIIFGDNSVQETSLTTRLDAAFLKANNALANVANATFGFSLTSPQTITANILTAVHRLSFSANGLIRTETGTGNFKNLTLLTGDEVSTGNSGSINITTGSGGAVSGYGGDINIVPGTGNSGYGKVNINVANNLWTFNTNGSIKFPDNTTQITASAPFSYSTASYGHANSAHTQANSAFIHANNAYEHANVAFDEGNVAYALANSAYYIANNALANTSGAIFAGNLNISGNIVVIGQTSSTGPITTGNLIVSGTTSLTGNVVMSACTYMTGAVTVNSTMVLANSNFSATEAAFRITAAGSSQIPTQAGTLMQITGKANTAARVLIDSFGTSNAAYSIIAGRSARGTVDAPTPTQNNDILLRIAGNSYGTTGYAPFGAARIDFVATENQTDTARGSRIKFYNTPNGSNVVNEIASFNADSVEFTGTVAPKKGFIYSPTILVGDQTAFTINYLTTSLIKATLVADLTISHSNYVPGKVVEVWLTNTGANPRTVTHGCTALNSSVNATTFTIPATSSAYLRYFSIGTDNANTFVAVQVA